MERNLPHYVRASVLKISRQRLRYWRKVELFTPSHFTPKGHPRYTFEDLKALKTIKLLREKGISVRRIKKCVDNIKKRIPNIQNPLTEIQLIVVGKEVVFVHDKRIFNALSMQGYFVDFIEVERWVGDIIKLKKHCLSHVDDTPNFFVEAKLKSL